jgi:FlaA1/EpsC-like NDP-sugar epimerase
LIIWRLVIRSYFIVKHDNDSGPYYWIYGASTAGILTYNALFPKSTILGYIDDNKSIQGKTINGLKIISLNEAAIQIKSFKSPIKIIVAIQNISKTEKAELVEKCIVKNLNVNVIPAFENWIHGELTAGQIKPVKIEDLLGRDEIILNNKGVLEAIQNKTILVTGAAGSIGSELVNQILQYNAAKIILVDQAETPLFELEQQILVQNPSTELVYIIADITQDLEIRSVFEQYPVELVFHAAAYKHVPMMENNPLKAVNCNLIGTSILADLAEDFGVEKFVFISTDKAVNPTNVMGATKRAAEIYIQSKNNESKTCFITTRFGNVLGSNGSVIPQFRKQIESGGPIKVTHPEITRYFMTIPEACQLVLEAGIIGQGGEIFIFDMGQSVKIVDLAKKMIALSGLVEGKDIEIVFTGLRPGEKLFEELLNVAEITLPTHHPKIMKSATRVYVFTKVVEEILIFKKALSTNESEGNVVKALKKLVPEYVSKNSRFEVLDNKGIN